MNVNQTLDEITINRLRIDMARVNAEDQRRLVVMRDQLLREVNSKLYGRFPKTKVRG